MFEVFFTEVMIQLWNGASGMILYSVCGNGDSNEVFSTGVFAELLDMTKLTLLSYTCVAEWSLMFLLWVSV